MSLLKLVDSLGYVLIPKDLDVGGSMRDMRQNHGVTRGALCHELNLTNRECRSWETGERIPNSRSMVKICSWWITRQIEHVEKINRLAAEAKSLDSSNHKEVSSIEAECLTLQE